MRRGRFSGHVFSDTPTHSGKTERTTTLDAMIFQSKTFQLAKDPEQPGHCQDAYALDASRGIGVIADGVASAIFSGQWAETLVQATVAEPPQPNDPQALAAWLAARRQQWAGQIDTSGLAWFQKAKLPTGAFSTLLWVQIEPLGEQREGAFGALRMKGHAIGDSCLLHFRGSELVRSFPIEHSQQLQDDPLALGSVDLGRDQLMQFTSLDELCYPDDLLVLCTDAVAEWALRLMESGTLPDWQHWWNLDESAWCEEINMLREQQQMRYDDATVMLLHVGERPVAGKATGEEPVLAEPVDETQREDDDWSEKFKNAGEQLADGIDIASRQAARGLKKWTDKAIRKFRDKFGPDDDTTGPG